MLVILAITFFVSILEHLRRNSKQSNKQFNVKVKKEGEESSNYLMSIMGLYVKIYWGFILLYHTLVILNHVFQMNISTLKQIQSDTITILLLVLSSITLDFTSAHEYFKDRLDIKNESAIKRKYAALCTAYDYNENKIYKRVTEVMARTVIDEMSNNLLDYRENKDVYVDFGYKDQCIIEKLKKRGSQLREKYLGKKSSLILQLIHNSYQYLMKKSNSHQYRDLIFLFYQVKSKN